jgi:hypothetical protein
MTAPQTGTHGRGRRAFPHAIARLAYALLSIAGIGCVTACVFIEFNRDAHRGDTVVTLSGHKGGRCRYTIGYHEGLIFDLITPWPCEQPRTRVVITITQNMAGRWADGPAQPFSPIPARVRCHNISDVLAISSGAAKLYVNPDGTVPFKESAMMTARPVVVSFWGIGVRYSGVWRCSAYLCALWLASTLLLVTRRARLWHGRKVGKCAKCGYDLRASKDRCP